MKTYQVIAARSGQWWSIEARVPRASVWTQTRRIDQIDATVREAIALALDVSSDTFDVAVQIEMPGDLTGDVNIANAVASIADIAQESASVARRAVALKLQEQGFTVRDIGQVLGLSSQRISQLISGDVAVSKDPESPMAHVRNQLLEIEARSREVLPVSRQDSARVSKALAKTG